MLEKYEKRLNELKKSVKDPKVERLLVEMVNLESELDELEGVEKYRHNPNNPKQIKIDPILARSFLLSIRECSHNDLEYQKLLVNLLIDRIYLYDDHFDIFLNNSDRKGKVSDYEAADIERYFDNNPDSSSITLDSGTPTKTAGLAPAVFVDGLDEVRSSEGGSHTGVCCFLTPVSRRCQGRK